MQSLTTPASVSKRKQACKSCRQRKKRCNGERPTCALCKKWGLRCEYTDLASSHTDHSSSSYQFSATLFGRQPFFPLDFELDNPDLFNFAATDPGHSVPNVSDPSSAQNSYPTPDAGPESFPMSNESGAEEDLLTIDGLPCKEVLSSLIDIFFEKFSHVFPCFHKASFMAELRNEHLQTQSPLLMYAMCCIACSYHPNPDIKKRQNVWYEQAKFLYDFTGRDPNPALRTMQAVLCLVYHAYTRGDFSACWLYLGKAWRQAAALGMNRMDSAHAIIMTLNAQDVETERRSYFSKMEWEGKSAIEKEECRRTLWVLFVMDRNQSWPTGWPHAIEERQFKIDIPVPESEFQAMSLKAGSSAPRNTPFTRSTKSLLASASIAKEPLNLFHHIIVAHVLLGRVTEQIHSLHDSPHTPEYAEQCDELDACILKLRLSLPRSATSVVAAPADARGHVVWLNCILNTMSILLHYRCAKFSDSTSANELFMKAVIAAKNTAQIVKDTTRVSIDLLLSAHIASSLYIAAVVLVIHSRVTGDDSVQEDIDLFALVFERMNDVFTVIGLKFTLALQRDLSRNQDEIQRLRDNGYRGLLADCSKWGFVQQEIARRGLTIG